MDADDVAPFFYDAAVRRVDVLMLGDSNQLFDGYGWDHGWILATDARFTGYATSLLSIGENGGMSADAGVGYRMIATAGTGQFEYEGAVGGVMAPESLLPTGVGMRPFGYVSVPGGSSRVLLGHGLQVSGASPIPVGGALRFHATLAEQPGGGAVRPEVRVDSSPFVVLAQSGVVETDAAGFGVVRASVEVAARPGDTRSISFRLGEFGGVVEGPLAGYFMRAEAPGRDRGVSCSSWYAFGSRSARDMAAALLAAGGESRRFVISEAVRLQGGPPRLLVRIHSALNDRNEEALPLDSNGVEVGLAPNSPEAYARNVRTIIELVEGDWLALGYGIEGLSFVITPSHPTRPEDDAQVLAYREAARGLARELPRCAMVDLGALTGYSEMLRNRWYHAAGGDPNHMERRGYEILAARELAVLQGGRSFFDADRNGVVDVEDLYGAMVTRTPIERTPEDFSEEGLLNAIEFLERGARD